MICFPWAGAGAAPFRAWGAVLQHVVSVYGVRLPGRESRRSEAFHPSLAAAVEELAHEIGTLPHTRVALFGMCSGALLAFELARAMCTDGDRELIQLLVASQLPPRALSEQAVVTEACLAEQYLDSEIRAEPELVALILPILVADMRVVAEYQYEATRPLDVPITIFRGADDESLQGAEVHRWGWETRGPAAVRDVPGADHLFGGESWRTLAAEIAGVLADA